MIKIDIKTTPINHPHTDIELVEQCKVIYGGVSWPSKREGCAVVVAMTYQKHYDTYDIYLLAEYESFDTRKLVRKCAALDTQFKPALWIGDEKNETADKFIQELRVELKNQTRSGVVTPRNIIISSTMILEIRKLYSYILPKLKMLLESGHRVLFLKDSNIVNYLALVEQEEIIELEQGEFPAIEALALAVIEMQNHYPVEKQEIEKDRIGYRQSGKRPQSPMVMG